MVDAIGAARSGPGVFDAVAMGVAPGVCEASGGQCVETVNVALVFEGTVGRARSGVEVSGEEEGCGGAPGGEADEGAEEVPHAGAGGGRCVDDAGIQAGGGDGDFEPEAGIIEEGIRERTARMGVLARTQMA